MHERQACIDCGTLSPETETNYTLISSQFGWRLTRTRNASGGFDIEWRCPECWKKHKTKKTADDKPAARPSSNPPPHPPSSREAPGAPATKPLPSFVSSAPPPGGSQGTTRPGSGAENAAPARPRPPTRSR